MALNLPTTFDHNSSFNQVFPGIPPTAEDWAGTTLSIPQGHGLFPPPLQPQLSTSPPAPQVQPFSPSSACGSPEERQQYYFHRYGAECFRKHSPEWINRDWLPLYKYSSADAIWDYWVEWKAGVDGLIAVEELTTTWGAKWRRNNAGLKSENTRRMKVINLISELSMKPRWNVNLVRRFITEKYASIYRARAFADYLTKNRAAVVTAANNYP